MSSPATLILPSGLDVGMGVILKIRRLLARHPNNLGTCSGTVTAKSAGNWAGWRGINHFGKIQCERQL
eukprot:scaffold18668_cov164-Amphora_coffeaeformis.AAC.2